MAPISGVFAAAVTPLTSNGQPDLATLPAFLDFLAQRGCHGALLLGTTGEGPSFSSAERIAIWRAAAEWRRQAPGFQLFAGTGTPSLSESIELNRAAFDLGFEAVLVLPPYFFRNAGEDGLSDWYAQLIEESVPDGKWLLGYHIPAVTGVALSVTLLQRLATAFPTRFGGLKDSSGSLDSARAYVQALPGKSVLVGNDTLLGPGLAFGAAGCITALANLGSPEARAVYDAYQRGEDTRALQSTLDTYRAAMDAMPPAPAYLKAMLHTQHDFPYWPVRPPLRNFTAEQTNAAMNSVTTLSPSLRSV